MRVIFLNRFYWPDEPATAQLLTDLAENLAAAGHDVTVIASCPDSNRARRRENRAGVAISRVTSTRWSKHGVVGKAADFVTFYLSALIKLIFTVQRDDCVVALTDPPLLGVGAWLVARLCGARIFHWTQDIYPEIAIVLSGHSWLRFITPLRNLAWRKSDGCVTLGSDMAALLIGDGVPAKHVTVLPNWAPAGLTVPPRSTVDALRRAWNLEGKFVVAYSGNLGRVHDLDPVLDVATALRDDAGIALVFIGGGAQRTRLEAQVAERELSNVHFHPSQARNQLATALALGDLHLVTLLPGCESLVFPSKLYGVTAVGRPVLFIGPGECEIARLVETRGLGRAFGREDTVAIAATIRELQGDPASLRRMAAAAAGFAHHHSGPTQAGQVWDALLKQIS
ncbi:MAG: glycosyltransferase family 4 protein [Opitutaceae bacterium]